MLPPPPPRYSIPWSNDLLPGPSPLQNHPNGFPGWNPAESFPYQEPSLPPIAPLRNMASYDSDSSVETDMESIFSSNSDYRDTSSKSQHSAATDHSVHSRHTTVDSEDDPRGLPKKKKKVAIHQPESPPSYQENRRRSPERRRSYVEYNKEAVIIPAKSSRREDSLRRIPTYRPHDRQSSIHRRLSFSDDRGLPPTPTSEHYRRELSDYPLVLRDEIDRQRVERDRRQRVEREELERQRVEEVYNRERQRLREDRLYRQSLPVERLRLHREGRHWDQVNVGEEKVIQDAIIAADREGEDRQRKDPEKIHQTRAEARAVKYEERVRRRAERGSGRVRIDTLVPSDLDRFSQDERGRRYL